MTSTESPAIKDKQVTTRLAISWHCPSDGGLIYWTYWFNLFTSLGRNAFLIYSYSTDQSTCNNINKSSLNLRALRSRVNGVCPESRCNDILTWDAFSRTQLPQLPGGIFRTWVQSLAHYKLAPRTDAETAGGFLSWSFYNIAPSETCWIIGIRTATNKTLIDVDFEICMSRNLGPEISKKKVNPIKCGIWSWSQILGRPSWPLVSRLETSWDLLETLKWPFHRANHLLGSRHVRALQTYLGSKSCILPMIITQSIRRHFPILFKMANVCWVVIHIFRTL